MFQNYSYDGTLKQIAKEKNDNDTSNKSAAGYDEFENVLQNQENILQDTPDQRYDARMALGDPESADIRIVGLGYSGCGNSSLMLRLFYNEYDDEPEDNPLLQWEQHQMQYQFEKDEDLLRLSYFDLKGFDDIISKKEMDDRIRDTINHSFNVILLYYSIDERVSFIDSNGYSVQDIKKYVEYWMSLLDTKKFMLILVGNKLDLESQGDRKISTTDGQNLAQSWGNIPFIEVSSKSGENIKQLLDIICYIYTRKHEDIDGDLNEAALFDEDKCNNAKTVVNEDEEYEEYIEEKEIESFDQIMMLQNKLKDDDEIKQDNEIDSINQKEDEQKYEQDDDTGSQDKMDEIEPKMEQKDDKKDEIEPEKIINIEDNDEIQSTSLTEVDTEKTIVEDNDEIQSKPPSEVDTEIKEEEPIPVKIKKKVKNKKIKKNIEKDAIPIKKKKIKKEIEKDIIPIKKKKEPKPKRKSKSKAIKKTDKIPIKKKKFEPKSKSKAKVINKTDKIPKKSKPKAKVIPIKKTDKTTIKKKLKKKDVQKQKVTKSKIKTVQPKLKPKTILTTDSTKKKVQIKSRPQGMWTPGGPNVISFFDEKPLPPKPRPKNKGLSKHIMSVKEFNKVPLKNLIIGDDGLKDNYDIAKKICKFFDSQFGDTDTVCVVAEKGKQPAISFYCKGNYVRKHKNIAGKHILIYRACKHQPAKEPILSRQEFGNYVKKLSIEHEKSDVNTICDIMDKELGLGCHYARSTTKRPRYDIYSRFSDKYDCGFNTASGAYVIAWRR